MRRSSKTHAKSEWINEGLSRNTLENTERTVSRERHDEWSRKGSLLTNGFDSGSKLPCEGNILDLTLEAAFLSGILRAIFHCMTTNSVKMQEYENDMQGIRDDNKIELDSQFQLLYVPEVCTVFMPSTIVIVKGFFRREMWLSLLMFAKTRLLSFRTLPPRAIFFHHFINFLFYPILQPQEVNDDRDAKDISIQTTLGGNDFGDSRLQRRQWHRSKRKDRHWTSFEP